jgi:hypothetical protein
MTNMLRGAACKLRCVKAIEEERQKTPHPARRLADLSPKYGGEVWVAGPFASREAPQSHTSPPYFGGEVAALPRVRGFFA